MNKLLTLQENELESLNNDAIASPFGKLRRQYHNGEFWMCAQDACNILGYQSLGKNTSNIVNRYLEEADHIKCMDRSSGQGRLMWYINYRGFIQLCLSSTLDNAKDIQEWIIANFFNSTNQLSLANIDYKLIARDPNFITEVKTAIKEDEANVSIAKLVRFVDCEDGILISDFAKALNLKELGPKKAYEYFEEKGYIYKKKNQDGWYPYQKYIDKRWLILTFSTYQKPDGSVHKTAVTKLTGAGVINIAARIINERKYVCISKLLIPLMK